MMLGSIGLAVAISIAWFMGNETISALFEHLNHLQDHPPDGAMTPSVIGRGFWLWGTALIALVIIITRVCPQPTGWARFVIVSVLVVLTGRYFLWRITSTLNLDTPLEGVFSLGLLFLELLILLSGSIQLLLLLGLRDRHREADVLSGDVLGGLYQPTVAVLIPSYDEPLFILKRTIMGCQAMSMALKPFTCWTIPVDPRSKLWRRN